MESRNTESESSATLLWGNARELADAPGACALDQFPLL
jgi:hypothetical protein